MERTLIIIKPDAMARGLIGEIISRVEKKGLFLVGCKLQKLQKDLLIQHYAHLATKPFFPRLLDFMESLPVLIQVWEGVEACVVVRDMVGETNGRKAAPGTVRGDFSMSGQANCLHTSDTPENAMIEIQRFFKESELWPVSNPLLHFVYSSDEVAK